MMVDPDLLRTVHRQVGDRLHREQQRRLRSGQGELAGANEQQYTRRLIADVIREHAEKLLAVGQSPLNPEIDGAGRLAIASVA